MYKSPIMAAREIYTVHQLHVEVFFIESYEMRQKKNWNILSCNTSRGECLHHMKLVGLCVTLYRPGAHCFRTISMEEAYREQSDLTNTLQFCFCVTVKYKSNQTLVCYINFIRISVTLRIYYQFKGQRATVKTSIGKNWVSKSQVN